MSPEEVSSKLAEVEARAKSNTHRIDALEKLENGIHELACSVKLMAANLTRMQEDVNKVSAKVDALTALPGKRWETVTMDIVKLLVAAAVGYVVKSIGF